MTPKHHGDTSRAPERKSKFVMRWYSASKKNNDQTTPLPDMLTAMKQKNLMDVAWPERSHYIVEIETRGDQVREIRR